MQRIVQQLKEEPLSDLAMIIDARCARLKPVPLQGGWADTK